MKRATALKVLAATLVVLTVASAIPVALILEGATDAAGTSSPQAGSPSSSQGAATRGLPFGPAGNPDAESPAADADGLGGPSSRPDLAGAAARGTGSALLDQVVGAARLMGIDATVPDLPLHKLDPVNPLRAAILGWVAATNAPVTPDELERELLRADALPPAVQRDVALLLLAATDAVLLQREATALLTPEQLAWIYAHPEIAAAMTAGEVTPETQQLATLAGLIDVEKSVQASLLLLTAVEATRGSLASAETRDALTRLEDSPDLDPATQAILRVLATAGAQTTDQEKVLFAARLVAATTGATVPAAAPQVGFADAVARLAAATAQTPDAEQLRQVLARADALPDDLEAALASIILAQALAVDAAAPGRAGTPAQGEAMARVLVTVAQALPTLEKHSLYWRSAPDALRVGQWSPQARIGWALEHGAHVVSTRGDPADVARAAALLHGTGLQDATLPERGFVDAYVALATEDGAAPNATLLADVRHAADRLDPRVAKAAALLMTGAAESARLQREAFSALTPTERDTLLSAQDLDAAFLRADLTQADVERLAYLSSLAARVDREKLAQAQLVAILGMTQARETLDALETQGDARPVRSGILGLLQRLVPWQTARAQTQCVDLDTFLSFFVSSDCDNDVHLIIRRGNFVFFGDPLCTPASNGGVSGRGCAESSGLASPELLVITGPDRSRMGVPSMTFGSTTVTLFGTPRVHLDLGGNDVYARPVAMTFPTQEMPVSLHLDMGGTDDYQDVSVAFDDMSPLFQFIGTRDGHPTQGSALGGGVAVLFDNWRVGDGEDRYQAPGLSQGYGQWGLGMLVDTGGDDRYVGNRLTQGVAGRDFNLGLGVLLDLAGNDRYRTLSGQGYGTGGLLADLAGADTYANDLPAKGAPIVHLTILPGGNLTTLHERKDNRLWLDGPAELNLGLGIDTETSVSSRNSDGDLLIYSDFVETVFGTDPNDRADSPQTRPAAQAQKLAEDTDGDGFPDFVERAFSTNAKDNRSMPFTLPVGPTFVLPPPVGEITPGRQAGTTAPVGMKGSDKVIDLRVPLQDAGSIDFACTGTLPGNPLTGNLAGGLNVTVRGVTPRDGDDVAPDGPCLIVGYASTTPGQAQTATPFVSRSGAASPAGQADQFQNRTLRYPVGILAIGDSVPTRYDVDYFVAIDLGGDDLFLNAAGGALPVTRSSPQQANPSEAFLAPSIVLNVDVEAAASAPTFGVDARNPGGARGDDTYANATGDYVQGAYWGILLDTAGADNYTGGGGAQGALGGLLLDLKGADVYKANDLSQGATLVTNPNDAMVARGPGLPDDGRPDADRFNNADSPTAVRRAPPGLHLDMGTEADVRKARNASQGYARGFGSAPSATVGAGILLDQGGDDQYLARSEHGRGLHAQAVATAGGIGILLDVKGNDTYSAWGIISQGATISQSYGADPTRREAERYAPGAALLLDTGGGDRYEYADLLGHHDRTELRQDRLTLQRGELARAESGEMTRYYADPAVHYDGEDVALGAVVGTGRRNVTSADPTNSPQENVNDLYVDLPAARLAIGGPQASRYEHEYAFIVDLGGANVYAQNAGGVVSDALVQRDNAIPGGHDATLSLFPVSFVLDAGDDASMYQARRGLVQGSGFFSVGVLVDLGGDDRFVALPQLLPSLGAAWASVPPTIDGSTDEPTWAAVPGRSLLLVDVNDSRFAENFTVRAANDRDNVYFAIEGHTPSSTDLSKDDVLRIDLNPGRSLAPRPGAEIDAITVRLGQSGQCQLGDGLYNTSIFPPAIVPDWGNQGRPNVHGRAACSYHPADGTFTIEVVKPLRPGLPRDEQDLDLAYDEKAGFNKADAQMGLRIGFLPAGAGDEFAWPPGTVRRDGEGPYPENDGDLKEEVSAWASFALASLGQPGVPANVTLTPALSQGAGLAGVGILAHLGTTGSNNLYTASDRAQGFAGFNGLALLLDAGGSDEYRGTREVQGYGMGSSFGALVDFEGNDNYRNLRDALGATPNGDSSSALFVDLGGIDEYDTTVLAADRDALAGDSGVPTDLGTPTPFGQMTVWRSGAGIGADYLTQDNVRGAARGLYAGQFFGVSRTTLTILRTDDDGDCTGTPAKESVHGEDRFVASGVVCLRAVIDLSRAADRGATFDVDAVDFLVGGRRFVSVNATDHNWTNEGMAFASTGGGKYEFTARLDTRGIEDGVAAVSAVSLIRATVDAAAAGVDMGTRGAVVFYDQATEGNVGATVRALINNPTESTLKLWPEFDGGADAVFSPNSALPGRRSLQIDWNVSHDSGEDRYGLKHNWAAPPELSNVPCAPNATRLCDLLPFYLRQGGSVFDTEPVEYLPLSLDGTFRQRSGDNPYTQRFPNLTTDLKLYKEDAFHLRLNTHRAILNGTYTTTIRVVLTQGDGDKITFRDESGIERPVVLAERTFSSDQNIGVGTLTSGVEPAREARRTLDSTILSATGNLATGDVFSGVVSTVHRNCQRSTTDPVFMLLWTNVPTHVETVCGNFYGQVGVAAVKPCQPPTQSGNSVRMVLETIYLTVKDQRPCKPTLMDLLNETSANGDNETRDTTREVGPAANNALSTVLNPPDSNPLNWLDFYLNATKPDALPPGLPAIVDDGETITVPPGYGMIMEMYIESTGVTGGDSTFADAWRTALDEVLARLPEYPIGGGVPVEGEPVTVQPAVASVNSQTNSTRSACVQCTGDSLYHDTAYNTTASQRSDSSSVGAAIDRLVQNPIPIAFFLYGDAQATVDGGGRQLPARFEVRVPAEPATTVDLAVEDVVTGDKLLTLLDDARAVGDVFGAPTPFGARYLQLKENRTNETGANYTVVVEEHVAYAPTSRAHPGPSGGPTDDSLRFTQYRYNFTGAGLADGVYRLNLTAYDDSTRVLDTKLSTFMLDSRPPSVDITTSEHVGSIRLENGALPIEWSFVDEGSGPSRAWVYYRVGDGEWKNATARPTGFDAELDAFPATTKRYLFQDLGSQKQYSFVVVGQDRAGNIEHDCIGDLDCLARPGDPLERRLFAAAMSKFAAGGGKTVTLDQTLPGVRGDGIDGARRMTFQSSEFTFVQAGSSVTFRACARDTDGPIGSVDFVLSHVLPSGKTITRVLPATASGLCNDGQSLWVHHGWGSVNADKETYPDGVWGVTVKAMDPAANTVTASMGAIILDSEAPRIRIESPVYPPGQSAVKPGDRLTLRIVAHDAFGTDDAGIVVDATQLTKQGPMGTRPVRIGGVTMQEVTFTVDRANLRNAEYEVRVTVPDNAGNVNSTTVSIPVDFKTFTIRPGSVSVTNVTHNSMEVRWNTTEPTTSQVRFGTSPLEMKLRTPLNGTLTTDHVVKLENLSPSMRYFLRAVSSTAGGYVNETDTLEALTGTALFLEALGPDPGTPLRGPVEVPFRGGLLDGGDAVTFTLEAQAEPEGEWSFVATTTETGDEHVLVFNTTRYLDGDQYRLRLSAESGKDKATVTMGPYLADNTAPRLTVVGPLVATNDTTPRLVAEAEDNLALFATGAATLLLDGKEVPDLVTETRGSLLHITLDVTEPLAAGPHAFELRAADRAGNVATETWRVVIDGEPPVVTANAPTYAPGREAAKLGGTATLNVTVKDASGVQSVTADTRGVSSQATTRLSRVTGTDHYVGTFPVTDASPDATHRIAITATDLAGNVREASVDVPVDNVAPIVNEPRASDVGQTRALLVADANEPILLMGTVTAPRAPPVQATGERLSTHAALELPGLLPSRTYSYTVQAVDRAGNAVELTGRFQTALDVKPPTDVKGLSVLDLLNGTLRLTWTAATDDVGVAFYRVYRSDDAGATFRPVAEVRGLVFDDVRVPLETTFTYQVVAVDHGGNEGPGSERLSASATALPRLSGGIVAPSLGSTATVFRYVVTYVSPGGVPPAYVRVVLDGAAQEMTLQPGGSPEEGLTYVYETRLAPHKRDAPHTYHFEASDGRYTVRFPELGEPMRGPLVSGDAQAATPLGSAAAFAQRVPLLGAAGLTLAFAAAAVIVLILRRRGAQ